MMYNGEHNRVTDLNSVKPDNMIASRRGLLITFEGIDGSGKTTQARHLVEHLRQQGLPVLALREPGGTAIGESIRQILLAKSNTAMSMETELLLFAAARAQLVREVILPALATGQWVVCDRFFDSTTAYQGYGRGLDLGMIRNLNQVAAGPCRPDRTFLLDLSVPVAVDRLNRRPGQADRLDGEDQAFMQRTRQGYLTIARDEPDRFILIDAGADEAPLTQLIIKHLKGDIRNEADYRDRT